MPRFHYLAAGLTTLIVLVGIGAVLAEGGPPESTRETQHSQAIEPDKLPACATRGVSDEITPPGPYVPGANACDARGSGTILPIEKGPPPLPDETR